MDLKSSAIFLALILASVPAMAEELIKLRLDDTTSISPKIESDTKVKVEGKSSVRISTTWPTSVHLGKIIKPDIENAQLIYTAMVKSELDGMAYLEMWAHVGGRQYISRGMNDMVTGKSDWKAIQKPDKVTLNLVINGTGTVWIDAIILSRKGLK